MPTDQSALPENIIIVDDAALYQRVVRYCRQSSGASALPSVGHSLCESASIQIGAHHCNIVHVDAENAHPLAYLTLGHRATSGQVGSVLAIGSAWHLVAGEEAAHSGRLAWVRKAIAVPYPALFESHHPDAPPKEPGEVYVPPMPPEQVASKLIDQTNLAAVALRLAPERTVGYAKHPTENGSLRPWHPAQFDELNAAGITYWSELACGVLEAARLLPEKTPILVGAIDKGPLPVEQRGAQNTRHPAELDWETVRVLLDGFVARFS